MLRKRMGWAVLMVLGLLCACEKVNLGANPDGPTEVKDGVRVRFCVDKFEQVPFDTPSADSRASVNISDICSRLSYAFFRTDGSLYVAKHQTAEEAGFGSLDISLPQDTYRVVVIAHSGSGTPTFAAADSIRFKDNKLTDTFFGSQVITVAQGNTYNLSLKRAVAKFRLVVDDAMPAEVKQMRFYYTGGSSTLNAISGYGRVNSRQTELREVTADRVGKASQFEVYSFPHSEKDTLKMEVTALDAAGATLYQKTFTEVPIQRNMITQYKGSFFGSSSGEGDGSITIDLIVDDEWTEMYFCY